MGIIWCGARGIELAWEYLDIEYMTAGSLTLYRDESSSTGVWVHESLKSGHAGADAASDKVYGLTASESNVCLGSVT